ncbi:uncharacterized protein APUU_10897A [Aspergillus puulaauensis]|uniref:Uncharacterized protein n=1 Tax=Aspergillus puulaauensis TaxID=1220207 RepID=A0A7R8AFY9_9EURO|nr:uncharacterized protein APUU_10897A [Aspergillus puulaauensis]BCS18069.1 hypothetical protein APUU_10897A [Aspergillus puulaauensis]
MEKIRVGRQLVCYGREAEGSAGVPEIFLSVIFFRREPEGGAAGRELSIEGGAGPSNCIFPLLPFSSSALLFFSLPLRTLTVTEPTAVFVFFPCLHRSNSISGENTC